jgi:hypothetical protein
LSKHLQLAEATMGVLSAAVCASALGWTVFRIAAMLPQRLRPRTLLGTTETIIDLAVPVDPERDHVRGPAKSQASSGTCMTSFLPTRSR